MDSGLTLGSQDDAPPTLDRSTEQASLAPDGRSVAHIVVDDGYPRAVQRFVRDGHALHSRWVTLPVAGPVIAVRHSPDSRWLACQVAPDAGVRDEVWLVTNDPEDPRSWPLRVAEEASVELVGWDGSRVVLAGVLPDGTCRARLVDPETGCSTILHEGRLSHVLDSWRGDCLVRIGPRSYRETQLVRADGSTVRLLPADHGSVTDQGVIVDPARAFRPDAGTETPGSPVGTRVFLRSNVHAGTHRLVEVLVDDAGRTTWRSLVERAGVGITDFREVAAAVKRRADDRGLGESSLVEPAAVKRATGIRAVARFHPADAGERVPLQVAGRPGLAGDQGGEALVEGLELLVDADVPARMVTHLDEPADLHRPVGEGRHRQLGG